jgi:hypothetical protein
MIDYCEEYGQDLIIYLTEEFFCDEDDGGLWELVEQMVAKHNLTFKYETSEPIEYEFQMVNCEQLPDTLTINNVTEGFRGDFAQFLFMQET